MFLPPLLPKTSAPAQTRQHDKNLKECFLDKAEISSELKQNKDIGRKLCELEALGYRLHDHLYVFGPNGEKWPMLIPSDYIIDSKSLEVGPSSDQKKGKYNLSDYLSRELLITRTKAKTKQVVQRSPIKKSTLPQINPKSRVAKDQTFTNKDQLKNLANKLL